MLKQSNCQPRLLYLTKLSFKIKGEIKIFDNKYKLRQLITTNPALRKILKGMLHTEEEERYTQAQELGKE
jgi:hypothetical protein